MPWDFVVEGLTAVGDWAAGTDAAISSYEAGAAADAAAGAGAAGAGEAAAAGAGEAAATLPDSYWSMQAGATPIASDAPAIGAGTVGTTGATAAGGAVTEAEIAAMNAASEGIGGGALTAQEVSTLSQYGVTPSIMSQISTATGLTPTMLTSLGGAAISSLAGLYGASKIASAGQTAANLSSNASLAATQLQAQQYADQVARQQPFYQAGLNALPAYTQGVMPGGNLVAAPTINQLQMDPGYGFRFDQGMKGLNASMAAKGLGVSGAGIKGAVDYGQAAGSQEYNNAYNRYIGTQTTQRNALAGLTGFAPTAAGSMASSGSTYANNVGNLLGSNAVTQGNAALNSAAATQSAYGGAGTAFANALNPNPMNAWFTSQLAKG